MHSTLLVASARPESSITRALRRIWFLTTRGGRSCGARRGNRTFCSGVQARTRQKCAPTPPYRRAIALPRARRARGARRHRLLQSAARTRPPLSTAPCSVAVRAPRHAAARPSRPAAARHHACTARGVRFLLRWRAALAATECSCDQSPAADAAPRRPAPSAPGYRVRTLLQVSAPCAERGTGRNAA
jgi:hypothetical protein